MKKTIIGAFILFFIMNLYLSFLSYKGNSSPQLHNEILKYFTQADILKGETNARAGFGIGLVQTVLFSIMILILSFSSLAKKLEVFLYKRTGNRFFLTSFCFFASLFFLMTLFFLPFDFYFSYILEHRFGFSNMTIGFWFWTFIKNFLLNILFVSLIGSAALIVIKKFKFYAVFIVPVGGLVIGLAMMIIYPIVILPLFYDISTIENHQLEKRIIETAQKSGVAVDKIYIIKESEYSNHTNAFFMGFGSQKKIYLYDTLIKNNSESEIVSILTHEIGHWVYNHNLKGTVAGFFLSLIVFLLIYVCVRRIHSDLKLNTEEIYSPSAVPLYILLFLIFSNITTPIELALSRSMERNADRYSLEMTKDPDSFISSEIRLARDNSARLNEHPVPAFFYDSHPATIERIQMAADYKKSMGNVNK